MDVSHKWNKSFNHVILGTILSLVLTLVAYFLVEDALLTGWTLRLMVFALGTVQAILQLILFLNLGVESKPRWSLLTFFFMVLVIIVIVGGSIWIMKNLDYNMMPCMNM